MNHSFLKQMEEFLHLPLTMTFAVIFNLFNLFFKAFFARYVLEILNKSLLFVLAEFQTS